MNRVITISREFGSGGRTIGKMVAQRRAAYYQFYTDEKWGEMHNYDICLNSSALGLEKCADMIAALY